MLTPRHEAGPEERRIHANITRDVPNLDPRPGAGPVELKMHEKIVKWFKKQ